MKSMQAPVTNQLLWEHPRYAYTHWGTFNKLILWSKQAF